MPVWTCPNSKCPYDGDLKPGQQCPLCGKEAQSFDFDQFGNILKQKWKHKKSVEKDKQDRVIARMIRFCPKCGSPNITAVVFYRPHIWKCLDCGYEGTFILQDGTLAEKLQKKHRDAKEEK